LDENQINKTITVRTNDKNNSEIKLTLSGEIKPIADISSSVVRLTGTAGHEIKQMISITPFADNRFKITEIKAEKGKDFKYELAEKTKADGVNYELTVYNLKKEKGWYTDKLHVRTDSTAFPEFEISVFGYIREP
jgi:hypothetical protein